MAPILCRATVNLQGARAGDVLMADPAETPMFFALGYLVPVEPLAMPDDEKPARHRGKTAARDD